MHAVVNEITLITIWPAASETEADELIAKASEFQQVVEDWIRKAHPTYGL
jgi:hypothetical protein